MRQLQCAQAVARYLTAQKQRCARVIGAIEKDVQEKQVLLKPRLQRHLRCHIGGARNRVLHIEKRFELANAERGQANSRLTPRE